MLRREGRLQAQTDIGPGDHVADRKRVVVRRWEQPFVIAAVVIALMLGAIWGINAIIAMFG